MHIILETTGRPQAFPASRAGSDSHPPLGSRSGAVHLTVTTGYVRTRRTIIVLRRPRRWHADLSHVASDLH